MRIIHGKDYYDSALAYGRDDNITFVRNGNPVNYHEMVEAGLVSHSPTVILREKGSDDRSGRHRSNFISRRDVDILIGGFSIFFCGKRYNGVKIVENRKPSHREAYTIAPSLYFWTKPSFDKWIDSVDLEYYDRLEGVGKSSYLNRVYKNGGDTERKIDEFFPVKELSDKSQRFMVDNGIAILSPTTVAIENWYNTIVTKEADWIANGTNLHNYDFIKALDPYTAMQELSMWVGGVLPTSGNPIVEITDDKIKVHKHGFDKWSFRKHKNDPK